MRFLFTKPFLAPCALICLCIGIQFPVLAQLKADFTMDPPNGGCTPLTVTFKNTTTGASASATYEWEFGNGTNKGYDKDAFAVYIAEKTYTVTLTVKDGAQSSSISKNITVYKKPTVDFSFSPPKGCAPFPVTFTSNSSAGDGTIAKYIWDFGDGITQDGANLQQTVHTYSAASGQTAILTIVNSHGCHATGEKSGITILQPIKADFVVPRTALCAVNESLSFTNKSTGPGTLSFTWDFGSGASSTDKDPAHTFTEKGVFPVTLIANSSEGCADTLKIPDLVNVANFTTDFDIPAIVCTNSQSLFSNKSTPAPTQTTWQISGVPGSYSGLSFTHTFAAPGRYTIKMTSSYGSCTETKEKEIEVKAGPKLDGFIADLNGVCGAPVTVTFTDTATSSVSWLWNFGSGQTAATKEASYTFNNDGQYSVSLQATDAGGCVNTVSKIISLAKPDIQIHTSGQVDGCPGFSTTFSVNDPAMIKDYSWNFGDGETSTEAAPKHTFNKAGNYTVTLDYTTTSDCKGTARYSTILVYEKPVVDFTASAMVVCGRTPVNFINQTSGAATNWQWDFGDGNPNGYYTGGDAPTYNYEQEGEYTVTLIGGVGSCMDTIVKAGFIKVLPPFPKITGRTQNCNSGEVIFSQAEATNFAEKMWWDFGNGHVEEFDPKQRSTTYTYPASGRYTVYLIAEAGQCTVRDSLDISLLLRQNPVLSANLTEVCGSGDLQITISGLEANPYYSGNNLNHYYIAGWLYGDGTSFNPAFVRNDPALVNNYSATITGLDNGQENIRLVLAPTTYPWCYDTSNAIPLKIKGPKAAFAFSQNNVCYKSPVVFRDQSVANDGIPVKKWEWTFGDGDSFSFADTGYPQGGLVEHLYGQPGFYYPVLKVTDADGCTATTPAYSSNYASVKGPKADFSYSPDKVFPYTEVYFNNTSITDNSNARFNWYFSNGPDYTNTFQPPTKIYTELGVDTVTMISRDPAGCTDTITKVIQIKDVVASFTYKDTYINNTSCPPVIVNFTNTSENAQSIAWDLGDGVISTGNNNTPTRTYYKSGVYKIVLYAYSNNNFVDSSVQYIAIKGPYAILKADTLSGCLQQEVTLSADVNNASSYTWDFGDGNLKQTSDTFATHSYATAGVYVPALIMKDGGGCSGTSELPQKIVIDSLAILDLKKEPFHICDSALVQFNPDIKSIAVEALQQTLSYSWIFGTGSPGDVSSAGTPSFHYKRPGKFPVTLAISSPYGCIKERTDTVTVIQTPHGRISGPLAVCQDGLIQFSGTADLTENVSWRWSFANGAAAEGQMPPAQLYSNPGNVVVSLIVENNGCKDTAMHALTVNRRPVVNLTPKNPAVCLGKSIQLNAEDGTQYQWHPSQYLDRANVANPVATPADNIRYSVEVTNAFGCKRSDSTDITVAKPFRIQLASDTFVCAGRSVQLPVTGAFSYQWINNTAGLSSTNSNNPAALPANAITYTVVGYDNYHCFTDTASVDVAVVPLPQVTAPADMELPTGSEVLLPTSASNDAVRWRWTPIDFLDCPTCPAPISTPRSDIEYTVTVYNRFGCESSDNVAIKLVCAKGLVYIPNAFTPNNDRHNDIFYVKGKGIRAIKSMRVFNRWGEVVFEAANINIEDPAKGWDGTHKGREAESAAYMYYIELICDTGEIFSRKGTITLIR
ncbi:MAG: PKD domain-containing protein [Chitinophagaceae bacterium]|nr:PKD domain-containing protein [Chitinophagaceae bacterium]